MNRLCNILIVCFLGMMWTVNAWAWDASGHMLVAQIAYNNLTPQTRHKIRGLLIYKNHRNEHIAFLNASVWPDRIKGDDVTAFNNWHFIDLPYDIDATPAPALQIQNVAWAIKQSEQVLTSEHARHYEQRLFLRFLIHFVGDIHQPLHCINLVSKDYPQGDQGGNLFPIKVQDYPNLHVLWDGGVGYWQSYFIKPYHSLNYKQVASLAKSLTKAFPKSKFRAQIYDTNPMDWAKESYRLAKQYAYHIQSGQAPSKQYIKQGQEIATQQVVLAGYRLAYILNKVYAGKP